MPLKSEQAEKFNLQSLGCLTRGANKKFDLYYLVTQATGNARHATEDKNCKACKNHERPGRLVSLARSFKTADDDSANVKKDCKE